MNEEQLEELLEILQCPITLSGELFANPLVTTEGHTYEGSLILQWLNQENPRDPTTRRPVSDSVPLNFVVVKIIEFLKRIRPDLKSRSYVETSLTTLDYFVNSGRPLIGFGEIQLEEYVAKFREISPATRLEALGRIPDVNNDALLRRIIDYEPLERVYLTRGGNPRHVEICFFWLSDTDVGEWALTLTDPKYLTPAYISEFASYCVSKNRPLTMDGIPLDHPKYPDIACFYARAGGPKVDRSVAIRASLEARLKLIKRVFVDNLFSEEEARENIRVLKKYDYTNLVFHEFQEKSFRWLIAHPDGLKQIWPSLHPDYIRHPLSTRIIGGTPLAFLYLEKQGTLPNEIDVETLQLQHLGKSLAHYAVDLGRDAIAFNMVCSPGYVEVLHNKLRVADRLRKLPSHEINIERVSLEVAFSCCLQTEISWLIQRMIDAGKVDESRRTELVARYHPDPVTALCDQRLNKIETQALARNDVWITPKMFRRLNTTKLHDSATIQKIGAECHYDKLALLDSRGCEKMVKAFPETFSYLSAAEQKKLIKQLDDKTFLAVFRRTEVYRLTAVNRQLLEERKALLADGAPR